MKYDFNFSSHWTSWLWKCILILPNDTLILTLSQSNVKTFLLLIHNSDKSSSNFSSNLKFHMKSLSYGLPYVVCNPRWHWLSHYWDIRPNCDKWAKTDKISFQWPIVYMIHLDLQSRDNDGILGLKWSIIYFELKASTLPIKTSFAPYCYFLSSATAPPKNGK